MRPAAGWGTVAELMDPRFQAQAFFGGPDGPNGGSPRGLLDIPGWQSLPKGVAAQSVEVSTYPDRYAEYEPVAEAILAALTTPGEGDATIGPSGSSNVVEAAADTPAASTTFVVFPLPEGTWRWTSGYGPRVHPVYGTATLHAGVDYVAPAGTPVLAVADGVVSDVSANPRSGNLVVIDHLLDGQAVATAYAHLLDGSVLVREGDPVTAGQQIAAVGSTGTATGPHLHFEVHPAGSTPRSTPNPGSPPTRQATHRGRARGLHDGRREMNHEATTGVGEHAEDVVLLSEDDALFGLTLHCTTDGWSATTTGPYLPNEHLQGVSFIDGTAKP